MRCLLTSSAFLPAPAPDASLHPTAYLLTAVSRTQVLRQLKWTTPSLETGPALDKIESVIYVGKHGKFQLHYKPFSDSEKENFWTLLRKNRRTVKESLKAEDRLLRQPSWECYTQEHPQICFLA